MTMRSRVLRLALILAAPAAASCMPKSPPATPDPAAPSPAVLTGTVAYRERMALPPDAIVDVWVRDVTPGINTAVILAQVEVPAKGRQVPIPFELTYDAGRVAADHTYAVKAVIKSPAGDILFETPGDQPVITQGNPSNVALMLLRAPGAVPSPAAALLGTSWRLADLAGFGLAPRVETTLEFFEPGRAGGRGGCNRYTGDVTIDGARISFGATVATQMACEKPAMDQETRYLRALGLAERFEIDEDTLLIHTRGLAKPLRFERVQK
jgi:putative lipoprotein